MFRLSKPRVSRFLALFMPAALMLGTIGAPSVVAGGVRKALINASTVSGSPSQEEAIATAAGFTVDVVTDATWGAMTAAQFGMYDLLIAGDPPCGKLPPGLISSASVYGPVVLGLAGGRTAAGNRVLVGTDPVLHDGGDYTSPGARGTIIREGIGYAGAQPGTTGMYFDSTCAANYEGQSAETLAILEALSAGSGAWTINADPPCGGSVSLIAAHPAFTGLTTASLQAWGCSVHESFPTFTTDWSALAVATDTPSKPTCGVDPGTGLEACGEAYILIAGSSIVVNSKVISVSPLDSTNPVGTSHTVTANVHDASGAPPVAGQLVDFSVTGVNTGATGTCVPVDCKSDVNGNVSFTYTDTNGPGDDTIKASFTDAGGSLQTATAQKHWGGSSGGTLYISLLLDRSGSMRTNQGGTIRNYNAWITKAQEVRPDALATQALFNSCAYKQRGPAGAPIADVILLTKANYNPRCQTPLYDAIAKTINRAAKSPLSAGRVTIVTYTDGHENASTRWTRAALDALIASKVAEGWNFVWLGSSTDPLVVSWAARGADLPNL